MRVTSRSLPGYCGRRIPENPHRCAAKSSIVIANSPSRSIESDQASFQCPNLRRTKGMPKSDVSHRPQRRYGIRSKKKLISFAASSKSCVCKRKLVCVNKGCSLSLSLSNISSELWLMVFGSQACVFEIFHPDRSSLGLGSRGGKIPSEKRIPLTDILCHKFPLIF